MSRFKLVSGLPSNIQTVNTLKCVNCPFGKQARTPFKGSERFPLNIGDVIVSDFCGPFQTSIGGYMYFITWIDMKTRYASIEFIKNKECATVTDSFRRYEIGRASCRERV